MSKNKTWLMPVLFGVGASMSLVFGYQLETADHVNLSDFRALFLIPVLALVIALLVRGSWKKLSHRLGKGTLSTGQTGNKLSRGYNGNEFFRTWMFISALNFIVLLGVYPGFFVYDAQTEVIEVLSRSFNTHHPLLHVLLLGGSVAFSIR